MHKAICAAALLATSAALAQAKDDAPARVPATAAAPSLPKPPPELAQLKIFARSYTCTGKTETSPVGPAHATSATFEGHVQPDKFWLQVRFVEKKSKVNPLPQDATEHWGYDAATKSFTRVVVDGLGGYGFLSAPGWEDDKLVFTGDYHLGPEKMLFRETFTKERAEVVILAELQMGGHWVSVGGTRCKQTAK